jgi:hypothetical protein
MSTAWKELALHGWRTEHPADWDMVVNRGTWNEGYLVLADGRHARINITWERLKRTPDLDRTLRRLDSRIRKDAGKGRYTLSSIEDLLDRGKFMRWVGPDGDVHGAIVRAQSAAVVFVIRDLAPSDGLNVKRLALACDAYADNLETDWKLYHIDVTLPPWWRLEGLQNLVGLTRAVWMNYPGGDRGATDVLTIRRFAMAKHILSDHSLEEWLCSHMNSHDTITERSTDDSGITRAETRIKPKSWIRRFRGERDKRVFYAWREEEMDRLFVQEWKGTGEALPCLR